jgi:DNA polymerase-3 subunit gamma/tau
VRDGLSLLDQAIALSNGTVTLTQVQDMLGLADRTRVLDMFEHALKGECPQALDIASDLYRKGADPQQLIEDMLDFAHLMTRLKAAPGAGGMQAMAAQDLIDRARSLSASLSMPALGRAWQLLLKGLSEVREAPSPHGAAEMILIRLAYAADLPDPADLLKKLKNAPVASAPSSPAMQAPVTPARQPEPVAVRRVANGPDIIEGAVDPGYAPMDALDSLQAIHALAEEAREMMLASDIYYHVHLVKMEPGRLEIRLSDAAEQTLPQAMRKFLIERTGRQWFVSVSLNAGQPTLAQVQDELNRAALASAQAHPLVSKALEIFPGAKLKIVKE